jgi:peptide/nickel transport system substrate-binding protein
MAMHQGIAVVVTVVVLLLGVGHSQAAPPASEPILPGPLAHLDIKEAQVAAVRGQPKGTLTIAHHFALSPRWLDPQEQSTPIQQEFSYMIHDAMVKPMHESYFTYSLAEHAEMTADFTKAAFRLRQGLKFHDDHPLTTTDVAWTYEKYRGIHAQTLRDKTDRLEIVDDRTIIFHFKAPFPEFLDLYNGVPGYASWILPKHYYEQVGPDGFKQRPMGAGPFKFISQQAGTELVVEAWDGYWRRTPGVKRIVVRHVAEFTSRLAALKTGEVDLAYGLTGDILKQVLADRTLRWDRNFTNPWHLFFPGYTEPDSPFKDKRVRQAISLAINRQFLSRMETDGIGPVWGNWIGPDRGNALGGDGEGPDALPLPEYNPEKARQLLAAAGYGSGLQLDWYAPFPPYFKMAERAVTDLTAVGIRVKVMVQEQAKFQSRMGSGRKGWEGNKTIIHEIVVQPGDAAAEIELMVTCNSPASFVCDPAIEERWARYRASLDLAERRRLLGEIQRYVVEEYLIVPLYINTFVQAVGPRVLPEGDAPLDQGFHTYWATPQAGFPYPWEVWEVKEAR